MRLRTGLAALVAAGALVAVTGTVAPGRALAYGAASSPVAQVELSANCDNPSFFLCSHVVGTGGIWFWVELDANLTGDLSGAACGHTVGGAGGPGGAGAGSIKQTVSWSYTSLEAAPSNATFFGTFDPHDSYYLISTQEGLWLIPTTTGHYSVHLTNGVSIQITVAP
jgi:hypothetical protein